MKKLPVNLAGRPPACAGHADRSSRVLISRQPSACLVSPLRSTAQGASGVPRVLTPLLLSCLMLISTRLFATDWPQWHGPTRDCHLPKAEPVPTSLPNDLKPVWKISVGGGFSSPVVAGD